MRGLGWLILLLCPGSSVTRTVIALFVLFGATACGQARRAGTKIQWHPGTPPAMAAAFPTDEVAPGATGAPASNAAAEEPTPQLVARAPVRSVATPTTKTSADAAALTAAQLARFRPNELGKIPILEWHIFTTDSSKKEQFTRPIEDFRKDLQWLYDHDFYVMPLRDIFLDQITAPPGKHPVALTFDDSTAGQFRFIPARDGSLTPDPLSAVGVLEEMFAKYPDFGRGGYFATHPTACFDWPDEPDQTGYCAQKLRWLLDHGYEIGNHTRTHADLLDLEDDAFQEEVGGATRDLLALAPDAEVDILTLPYGNYPDPDKHPQQREWMRDGFDYEGTQVAFLGALMVGADPASSPASTEWDPVFTPRIQAFDEELARWFPLFADEPSLLYTSDGDPETVTIPTQLHPALEGTFDPGKAEANDKRVVEYDPPPA